MLLFYVGSILSRANGPQPFLLVSIKCNTGQTSCSAGEENLGKDYFEGDMMLTPDQQDFLDKIKNADDTQDGTKRALIKDKMYLWPKAKVYYNFDKGVGMCMYKVILLCDNYSPNVTI